MSRPVRLVYPHQLFAQHLQAAAGTTFVMVEDDLFFRQYRFHTQKLVLHRASMRRFATRLREAGYDVEVVETDGRSASGSRLVEVLERLRPDRVRVYDVVDDWLARDCTAALTDAGYELRGDDVLESPNFLTTRQQLHEWFGAHPARMQHFYSWQRQRLDVLVEGDRPVGGQWSFDPENRKKLPKDHPVPEVAWPARVPEVDEAIDWVRERFPDNPGDATAFHWPTSHDEAAAGYRAFLAERFEQFGPYEDAIAADQPFLFHSAITPGLNIGLLDPHDVLDRALEVDGVELASLEGFVRQLIGWREYMRATYHHYGRRMRSGNRLVHTRPLAEGWWTAEVGLAPIDRVVERVLEHGWCHHIERLMVLGNAMCLMRTDPDAVYEWFMEMFVDAYDWVMVPNVYAMSQFAAGEAITTKPYVSGSNYLRKMSDFPRGDWDAAWDGLYWTFVRDHRDVFEHNARSNFAVRHYDGLDAAKKAAHTKAASPWL
ncbi:cryptochrome/photolyase family protein [Nocardioides mangrovicus]|uniref:Cryptochrome/photolyase family protein n=1 Tax=Nocardioides mangrovicus TaxID=2478913 RepID=A0A3L8P1M5_9ACTN|nr:cryptochrome/photolyase family protein [Nocardioides mangrovicus]RLV49205.1 cryptochrome/photolyase family protein [Nocardioides mangrovicus]